MHRRRRDAMKILVLLFLLFSLISCAASVSVVPYDKTLTSREPNCSIDVYYEGQNVPKPSKMVGEIKVDDTGFSVNCDTQTVHNIIRSKACEAGADAIQLFNVRHPDFWSTCFRASAHFLKYTDNNEVESETDKKPSTKSVKSDIDDLPSLKAKVNKSFYAIVIGIEQYRQKLPSADFAVHDAQTVTKYLTNVLGYPEENVVTLINDHAAKSDLEKYFEKWLLNNVEKDGTVFIYYSGHGAPNPKTGDAYLVPFDGDPTFIEQTGYPLKRLYESLGKLPAKEIVVALDSCFSGGGGRSVLSKGARPLVINLENSIIPAQNIIVMSAASGDQISSTYAEKGHGLFTYFMLKGIKDESDIAIGELFSYIKPQVERIARKIYNNEQSPQLIGPESLLKKSLR